jgi:hypothetical protein
VAIHKLPTVVPSSPPLAHARLPSHTHAPWQDLLGTCVAAAGQVLFLGDGEGTVLCWDTATGKCSAINTGERGRPITDLDAKSIHAHRLLGRAPQTGNESQSAADELKGVPADYLSLSDAREPCLRGRE